MFRPVLFIVLTLLFSVGASAQQREELVARIMNRVADQFIIPRYEVLVRETALLKERTASLCDAPSDETLAITRAQFGNVVEAWGSIEMVRFGPILAENRLERFLFFPDRKSTGLRRVIKLLRNQNPKYLHLDGLLEASVAAQGLPAFEYALFGKGFETMVSGAGNFRCRYASTIAANLHNMATVFEEEWKSDLLFVRMWREPGPHNAVFNNARDTITHLVTTLVHGVEEVRDVRLANFLKAEPGKDRPKSAPLWRSRNSFTLLRTDLESLAQLFEAIDFSPLAGDDQALLVHSIRAQFASSIKLLQIDETAEEVLASATGRERLAKLRNALAVLMKSLERDLGGHLGINVGFFFADGD